MKRMLISMVLLGTMSLLPACGGGGGGGGAAAPTTAVVRIFTTGTLPTGTLIGAIDASANLPAGVSVHATADSVNPSMLVTDSGVVTVSGAATGANTTALGTYNTATNRVAIHVVNADGFGTGEFATVTCDIAAGTTVTAADFSTGTLSVADLNGVPITALTAGITVELQ